MDLKIRAVFFCVLIHAVKRICQESIADSVGVPQRTVSDVIESSEKGHLSIFAKEFKPLLFVSY